MPVMLEIRSEIQTTKFIGRNERDASIRKGKIERKYYLTLNACVRRRFVPEPDAGSIFPTRTRTKKGEAWSFCVTAVARLHNLVRSRFLEPNILRNGSHLGNMGNIRNTHRYLSGVGCLL